MSNRQQRMQNRANARELTQRSTPCPECGMTGWESQLHWITGVIPSTGMAPGFWTCPKFYGPDGRRDEGIQPTLAVHPDHKVV